MLQFQGEFQPENESFRTNISLLRVFICTGAVRCFGGPDSNCDSNFSLNRNAFQRMWDIAGNSQVGNWDV